MKLVQDLGPKQGPVPPGTKKIHKKLGLGPLWAPKFLYVRGARSRFHAPGPGGTMIRPCRYYSEQFTNTESTGQKHNLPMTIYMYIVI